MIAGEKGYGSNGLQNALFPFDEMYITQGENTGISHIGMDAIDFVGWDPQTGQSGNYNYPYYAPFDCELVAKEYGTMLCWQSLRDVNRVDGSTGIVTIGFGHDDNYNSFTIGETRLQGELIGHTGTNGASGDHCHMEVVPGVYAGFETVPQTGYKKMVNSDHIYYVLGINDTIIYRDLNYPWEEFSINLPYPPTPVTTPHTHFKWVLYARKLREKR